jgi:hypothetical protein
MLLLVAAAAAVRAQSAPATSLCAPAGPGSVCDCSCVCPGCPDCCCAPKPQRFWAEAGYLLWWFKDAPLPVPIVTTDPTNGATPTAGGLADPTTQVLIGDRSFASPTFSGLRVRAGYGWTEDFGIEGGGFWFGTQSSGAAVASDSTGNPFLFRPVFNVDTDNSNAGLIVAFPGAVAGGVAVNNTTRFWGADGLVAVRLADTCNFRLTGLAGFRYLDLRENLDILDSQTDLIGVGFFGGVPTIPGDRVAILDSFHTHNHFYGGELGLRGEVLRDQWVLSGTASVALGCTQQVFDINGFSTLFPVSGAAPTTLPGGLLALPSNSGRSTHGAFSVVPQVGGQVGYNLNANIRLSVGYDFLYWTNVVRPGSQINPVISAAQVPVSPSYAPGTTFVPGPPRNSTDFWAQGVSFSVGFSF